MNDEQIQKRAEEIAYDSRSIDRLPADLRRAARESLPTKALVRTIAYALREARAEALEDAAKVASRWALPDNVRAHAGELSADQMRAVVVMLNPLVNAIRKLKGTDHEA